MATLEDYFSFQVFLIVLRETLESAIIVSVLLAFLHQRSSVDPPEAVPDESLSIYKYLRLQVWIGGFLGLVCCLILGSVILSIFYVIGNDLWAVTEHYWEGTFSIVASIIISVMGIKILRVNKMQEKWKAKLTTIIKKSNYLNRVVAGQKGSFGESVDTFSEKYSMFILPFITTLREGMEAIVFIGGIGINENTSVASIVISTFTAIIIGSIIGILLYRTGNSLSLQWFLMCSTGLLYLIAAGLFSKGVWNFELQKFIDRCDGFDVSETGHGPGSYDITKSVWHVNCCNGELQDDGAFWMIATAVLGWTNSATYGSIFSYLGYWVAISCVFTSLVFEERHGYLPVIPVKLQKRRIKKKLLANQMIYNSVARDSLDSTSGLMA
ncbi:iron permease FTR1 [Yamadazyma tenuis ATCC 10573]|uniref:Iron permease FTR1 n=1 Tax=Candida tenuis (strain ATCC 10573 / BCRC 21748 / CBS 615 / JCM 9827 / NBRC 10315 / NRRL Y-1498 / VKM Y-70) TaxID=590646 RepID=G3B0B2_CANTC|nr:iron permease FTR1 [Yamadazyma tenuis ATCC 10573]EGV65358.1 iron permease FTR1 [Yamadazyma tenuis ATCC 10573]